MFSGQVTAIEKEAATRTTTATLRVSEVWKGPERGTLEVSTSSQGSACGYAFQEGQEYLVYAYGKQDLKVSACGGTTHLSKADEDLALLGNGEKPKDGGDVLNDTSGGEPVWGDGRDGGAGDGDVLLGSGAACAHALGRVAGDTYKKAGEPCFAEGTS